MHTFELFRYFGWYYFFFFFFYFFLRNHIRNWLGIPKETAANKFLTPYRSYGLGFTKCTIHFLISEDEFKPPKSDASDDSASSGVEEGSSGDSASEDLSESISEADSPVKVRKV